jgi:hypothetical protein
VRNDSGKYEWTTPPFGWADAIQPYIKSVQLFQCPSEKKTTAQSSPTQSGYTDYWFNKRLSSATWKAVQTPALTIMSGDGNSGIGGTDARYSKDHLPDAWRTQEGSPARRHLGRRQLFVRRRTRQVS